MSFTTRLKALAAFDEAGADMPSTSGQERYWCRIGIRKENTRLRPLVEALIEALETADRVLHDPKYTSQIALAAWSPHLARLKEIAGEK